MTGEAKRLYRPRKNRVLSGVCGGIGDYFGIDPVIVRLVFIFTGVGLLAYIVMAIIIPIEP
ncbi:MAG: PspC domain-containing protein [Caldisericia bacterium]|nr:PspC domain-containing protein [Caldisericia bacterium]